MASILHGGRMTVLLDRWIGIQEERLASHHGALKRAGPAQLGLERLDGVARDGGLGALIDYASRHAAASASYFAVPLPPSFEERGRVLAFDSQLRSGAAANDRVEARYYPSCAGDRRAVLLIGHWNSRHAGYARFGRALAAAGISCLHLSLPYHDARETPGAGYAREMASENLGLTIQAHRQAIVDARAAIGWLEARGHACIGLVGVSLGSSIGSIVAAHDPRVAALVLVLMADDLAEVIWTGSATTHLRAALEESFTLEELKAVWSIISPNRYARLLAGRLKSVQIISARRDSVFLPHLTAQYVERLRTHGVEIELNRAACGHYSLALFPFNLWCVANICRHLRKHLQ